MLISLWAENFRCFRDRFELSMVAEDVRGEEPHPGNVFTVKDLPTGDLRLLKTVGIYGPNASGKSAVVMAALALRGAVIGAIDGRLPDTDIEEFTPFILDQRCHSTATTIGVSFLATVDGVLQPVDYELSVFAGIVASESLVHYPKGVPNRIFRRKAGEKMWFGTSGLASELKSFESRAHETMPMLSVLGGWATKVPQNIAMQFKTTLGCLRLGHNPRVTEQWTVDQLGKSESFRMWVNQVLPRVDVGVESVRQEVISGDEFQRLAAGIDGIPSDTKSLMTVFFRHKGIDPHDLNIAEESDGTRKLLAMLGPSWDVIERKRSFFVDEFSASMHTDMARAIVELFHRQGDDDGAAQMVFTTHDVNLFDEKLLRRDQIYLTEKDDDGAAELIPLAEYKIKKDTAFRKNYLAGRFGGMPRIGDLSVGLTSDG